VIVHYETVASENRVIRNAVERVSAGLDDMPCFDMEGVRFPCLVKWNADLTRDSVEGCEVVAASEDTYSTALSDQTTISSIQSEIDPGPGTKLPYDYHSSLKIRQLLQIQL